MVAVLTPTKGESLLIWRRRKGLSQIDAANQHAVSPDKYREWESDKRVKDQPREHLGELKPHEICYLKRRRKGLLQRQIAEKIGTTRLWVIKMEEGAAPCDRLCDYWGVRNV